MSHNLLILSKGIRRIEHGPLYTPEFDDWVFNRHRKFSAIAGWGHRPTADKAREMAKQKGVPYIALEDGFLRSVRLGKEGSPPLSLVADSIGIYYDARQPSQLEKWLESGQWSTSDLLIRAEQIQERIVGERLSKYNHAPERQLWQDNDKARVLVVDQTFGDISVAGSLASEASFREMLQAAMDENPGAEIVIKTHPDVVAGYSQSYLPNTPIDSRIQILSDLVNPWSVMDGVSKVYTVSSLFGFEALLAGKEVRCFGLPFYAGWGLTKDELSSSRRTRKCSLTQIVAAAYLKYARYVDPIQGKQCEIEQVITLLVDERRRYLKTSSSEDSA